VVFIDTWYDFLPFDFVDMNIEDSVFTIVSDFAERGLRSIGMVKGSMQLIDDDVALRLYDAMPPAVEASGGSAANTAAGIASFGGSVAFVGKVAGDLLGEVFTHDIRATGVRYHPVEVSADQATARCLILVTPDAQRTMNTFLGVSSLISPSDVDASLVATAQVVYCEGYLWDLPAAKAALVKGMDVAKDAGGKVAFTLSDSFCVDRHRAEFLELAEHRVDILFANEAEITSLYETDSFDEAADRVAGHCEIACLTRSEQGSTIITASGERVHVPAEPIDRLVDTTGAGDLYASGFLYGYTRGLGLAECGRLGAIAAAEVISHMGARPEVDLNTLI
jgi:sugar/nucleoside kinase (ribokinase family)